MKSIRTAAVQRARSHSGQGSHGNVAFKRLVEAQNTVDQSDESLDCYILSPCLCNKINILGEMPMSDVLYIYLFTDIEFIKSTV